MDLLGSDSTLKYFNLFGPTTSKKIEKHIFYDEILDLQDFQGRPMLIRNSRVSVKLIRKVECGSHNSNLETTLLLSFGEALRRVSFIIMQAICQP